MLLAAVSEIAATVGLTLKLGKSFSRHYRVNTFFVNVSFSKPMSVGDNAGWKSLGIDCGITAGKEVRVRGALGQGVEMNLT